MNSLTYETRRSIPSRDPDPPPTAAGPATSGGPADDLSLLFAALADPTRRAILSRLAEGEATVQELTEPFAMTFQAVSKHLKVLERAGLVSRSRQAQYRPVRLEPEGFDPATRWIEEHREMRLAQLGRLEQTIHSLRRRSDDPRTDSQEDHPTDRSPR